jgi:hypothetical protein
MSLSLLHSLVSAAYAKGSHHKLALDALNRIRSPEAERWHRLFLKHAPLYLEGSKAPDVEFKDFKNHVLHPRDGYWGGAPAKAQSWYHNLVEALAKEDWDTAAYCAGVLSHYCVDPLHPFHTAQSEAENNIHRAAEWTISKSYNDLRALGDRHCPCILVSVPNDANWLAMLVCQGADKANAEYEKLIAHYDITRGVSDPVTGFDEVGRKIVAELIHYASEMFAIVLDRAFLEAKIAPPDVSLTAEMFLATLKMPLKWVSVRLADSRERRLVEAMYDELKATGKVEKNLPEDDRAVRDLHATEILAKRTQTPAAQVFPFQTREKVVTRIERNNAESRLEGNASGRQISAQIVSLKKRMPDLSPRPAPPRVEAPAVRQRQAVRSSLQPMTEIRKVSSPTTSAPVTVKADSTSAKDTKIPLPSSVRDDDQTVQPSTAERLRAKMIDIRATLPPPRPSAANPKSAASPISETEPLPPTKLGTIVTETREYLQQLETLRRTITDSSTSSTSTKQQMSQTNARIPSAERPSQEPQIAHARLSLVSKPAATSLNTHESTSRRTVIANTASAPTETIVRTSADREFRARPDQDTTDRDINSAQSTSPTTSQSSPHRAAYDWSSFDADDSSRIERTEEDDIEPVESDELNADADGTTSRSRSRNRTERTARGPRVYLTREQNVVDAPSIGPKTAEKLYAVGIDTVDDLLRAHPIALTARLETKSITPEIITDWQDQARLVCTIPTLRGTHAQLLVGAGYRDAAQVAEAEPEKLCADILNYAISKEGQRLLREGNPPDVEKIKSWIEHARSVKAA